MFFPIGDTPNPRFTPWVNWFLIVVNVLVYLMVTLPMSMAGADPSDPLLQVYLEQLGLDGVAVSAEHLASLLSAYDLFVYEHGYKPGAASVFDLFSAMFLHAGLWHLLGNMLFLWIYGDNVEHRLGHARYLVVYLLSGVAATLGFSLLAGGSMTPLIGASGAISGVLGLYFIFFPRNKVKVFVFLFPIVMRVVLLPSRLVLGVYLVWDNILPLLVGAGGNVAHGAHLGGFLAGLAFALGMTRLDGRSPRAYLADGESLTLDEALKSTDTAATLAALRKSTSQDLRALSVAELTVLTEHLARVGHADVGVWMLRRAQQSSKSKHPGLSLAQGLLWLAQDQEATAYQHLSAAIELDPGGEAASAAHRALQKLNLYRP